MKRFVFAFFLTVIYPAAGFCDGYFGRVIQVWAGDRLDIKHNGRPEHIRVYGVECPKGSYGSTAREFTRQLADARSVHVMALAMDGHGNTVAHVHFVGGRSLSDELVSSGMARWSRTYAPHDRQLARLEAEARAAHRGCWVDPSKAFPRTVSRTSKRLNRTITKRRTQLKTSNGMLQTLNRANAA